MNEWGEKDLPRWIQIPAGILLGIFTLFCGFASVVLLFGPNKKSPILAFAIVFVLLLSCAWVLEKCFRLLTGRKRQHGLLSPRTLRIASVCMLVLPIIGLFTGYYREMGKVAIFQALMYFVGFFGLRAFAQKREANDAERL
jgi:membrane associated rhomboid family serine protease